MKPEEIDNIVSATDEICVSIIVPTHRFAENKQQDRLILKKAIKQAKELLRQSSHDSGKLEENLDTLYQAINFSHTKDGIGIFVSPQVSARIDFPFPVEEKVRVGDHFEIRELLIYKNLPSYRVLSLSHKTLRLYFGKGEEILEVHDNEFPKTYEETYEYERASIASPNSYSLKAFEKDKSVTKEIRFRAFLRSADRSFGNYLPSGTPVILSGVTKDVVEYKRLSKYRQHIVGWVPDSHDYNKSELYDAVWDLIRDYSKAQRNLLLVKFREFLGLGTSVFGLYSTLDAIRAGKGLILLVEKDLQVGTYNVTKTSGEGNTTAENAPGDVVDAIIRSAIHTKCRIVFMENAALKDFEGVALILRYNGYPLA